MCVRDDEVANCVRLDEVPGVRGGCEVDDVRWLVIVFLSLAFRRIIFSRVIDAFAGDSLPSMDWTVGNIIATHSFCFRSIKIEWWLI